MLQVTKNNGMHESCKEQGDKSCKERKKIGNEVCKCSKETMKKLCKKAY